MVEPTDKNNDPQAQNASPVQEAAARFKALPRQTQIFIVVGVFVLLLVMLSARGGDQQIVTGAAEGLTTTRAANQGANEDVFSGLETNTPELMKGWFNQSQQDLSNLKDQVERQMDRQDQTISQALGRSAELEQEMKQVLEDFKAELLNLQENEQRDREVLGQLAEETRKLQLNSPATAQATQNVPKTHRGRISQTPLGSTAGVQLSGDQALLGGVAQTGNKVINGQPISAANGDLSESQARPFIPPLGFIKATLLNGVDALVGGTSTPALARLHGSYKTAHNGTVMLDGCFMLIEFNGEISTERAIGKPSRMTCVYPDQGVATYGVSGYVVDAEDGIIGIPGIFYEGDATRLAAAMVADFAAGLADVIESNQSTYSVDSDGTSQATLTGNQTKAQLAGGVNSAVGSLRDYLMERADRVTPFIRIDATRTLHVVMLSGVELRTQGNPWTLLFDAEAADAARAQQAQQQQQP